MEPVFRSGRCSRLWAVTFTPEEDQLGANQVVLLSWSLFQRRFAGDPSVIGKQIRLDSASYDVIGVLPRWFTYPDAQVQLWVPYASTFDAKSFARARHASEPCGRPAQARGKRWPRRPGSERAAVSDASCACSEAGRGRGSAAGRCWTMWSQDVKTPLVVLLCAVGCMLLIACLNVSNLLVARGAARRKELAVRGALRRQPADV